MHCLRWWLPLFILPLPAASPYLLLLFVVAYAIKTKPCAYCSLIVMGLMISTASWYDPRHLGGIYSTSSHSPTSTASSLAAAPAGQASFVPSLDMSSSSSSSAMSLEASQAAKNDLLESGKPVLRDQPVQNTEQQQQQQSGQERSQSPQIQQARRKRRESQASYYWLSLSHLVWNFCGQVGTKRQDLVSPVTPAAVSVAPHSSPSATSDSPAAIPDSVASTSSRRLPKQDVAKWWQRAPSRIHIGWGDLGYGIKL